MIESKPSVTETLLAFKSARNGLILVGFARIGKILDCSIETSLSVDNRVSATMFLRGLVRIGERTFIRFLGVIRNSLGWD